MSVLEEMFIFIVNQISSIVRSKRSEFDQKKTVSEPKSVIKLMKYGIQMH